MSVAVSPQLCTWCLGDMRPLDGAPSVFVCPYCGRAVSFKGDAPQFSPPALVSEAPPAIAQARAGGRARAQRAA